jgi:hypothetical protein
MIRRLLPGLLLLAVLVPAARPATPPGTYVLAPRAARGVSAVVRFLDAFNGGQLGPALAQFTRDPAFIRYVGVSDCDFRREKDVKVFGRADVEQWLRARFADHDRVTPSTIFPIGIRGAGVWYSRRTSDTLRALGFPAGIQAGLGSKVGFTTAGPVRLTTFANNSPIGCKPAAGPEQNEESPYPPLTARQAREVSAVVRFVDAFNALRPAEAAALLAKDVVLSDCDYRRARAVEARGRRAAERWLRERSADHDRLVVGRIANENPEQPTGVLEIAYGRRTSDTLRALGFPAGVVPRLRTKVVLTPAGPPRIAAFANGPVGGSPELCRP